MQRPASPSLPCGFSRGPLFEPSTPATLASLRIASNASNSAPGAWKHFPSPLRFFFIKHFLERTNVNHSLESVGTQRQGWLDLFFGLKLNQRRKSLQSNS